MANSSSRYQGVGVLSTRKAKKMLVNTSVGVVAVGLSVVLFSVYEFNTSPEKKYGKQGYTLMTAQAAKRHQGKEAPQNIPGAKTFLPAGHHYYEANFDGEEAADFLTTLDRKQIAPGPITRIEWFGAAVTVTFENGCEVTRTWDISHNPGKISPMHDITKECDKADLPPYS